MQLTKEQERALDLRRARGYGRSSLPNDRDGHLQDLMRAAWTPGGLARVLGALHPDSADVLAAFAMRMATLAVRTRDVATARCGLSAVQLAMATTRDSREVIPAMTLLYRSLEILGADAAAEFRNAYQVLPVSIDESLPEFAARSVDSRSLSAMLYHEEGEGETFTFICDW